MDEFFSAAPQFLLVCAVGYLIGAIPLAGFISRLHGVDIFTSGTGLAGASNVRRSVGTGPAVIVALGDLGKGAAAVFSARALGIQGTLILLPIAAAVVGHWNSIFSGFRGGDGMLSLGGATIALFPIYGLIAVSVGLVVSLGAQKMPYTSLLGMVFAYLTLTMFTIAYAGNMVLVLGVGGIAAVVLAHAIMNHLRFRRAEDWEDLTEGERIA